MQLEKNQILITLSEDKKILTVECGAIDYPINFSACPDKPIKNIGKAIIGYDERVGLSKYHPEWIPSGCMYKGTGTCDDCN